jgi:restriction system protein
MTLDDLSRAIIDAYDRFDNEGRALLPLTRIYWPA